MKNKRQDYITRQTGQGRGTGFSESDNASWPELMELFDRDGEAAKPEDCLPLPVRLGAQRLMKGRESGLFCGSDGASLEA